MSEDLKKQVWERFRDLTYREAVEEIVRQMEWARRECAGHVTETLPTTTHMVPFPPGSVEIRGVRVPGLVPLTLAPDDWKP